MSDVDRLLSAFASGSLVRPSAGVTSIVDLARAVAMLAGAEGVRIGQHATELAEMIGPSDHLIFVLADGVGLSMMEQLSSDSFLLTHLAAEIMTVFPSTTAVALTTLATGEWPTRHAVTGWWTHLPEMGSAAAILPFTRRSDKRPLDQLGVTPEHAFPFPALTAGADRDPLSLLPERIAGSVYSAYAGGGHERRGYRGLRRAVDIAVARTRDSEGPTYTYIYTDRVDAVAHRRGSAHELVHAALVQLDRELARLHRGLDGRGVIVVSADHGFLDAPREARHQITASDPVLADLRFPPSGDARVMYLHVSHGAEDRVRELFQKRFGGRFFLISADEADALELFGPGPMSRETRSRIGDLVAISCGPDVIAYQPGRGPARLMSQESQHSGLTPQEMRVPLVVA
ncbi:MAG: alkaline phosphatase family protein [Chloroflexi bacterium]|nr:alkaline phosphatase family protein [Chloroflexota bacterium]